MYSKQPHVQFNTWINIAVIPRINGTLSDYRSRVLDLISELLDNGPKDKRFGARPTLNSTVFGICNFSTNCLDAVSLHK